MSWYQQLNPLEIGISPLNSRGNQMKRRAMQSFGQQRTNFKKDYQEALTEQNLTLEDNEMEGMTGGDFERENAGETYGSTSKDARHPSAMRKQYCSSQKQGERFMKRNASQNHGGGQTANGLNS